MSKRNGKRPTDIHKLFDTLKEHEIPAEKQYPLLLRIARLGWLINYLKTGIKYFTRGKFFRRKND